MILAPHYMHIASLDSTLIHFEVATLNPLKYRLSREYMDLVREHDGLMKHYKASYRGGRVASSYLARTNHAVSEMRKLLMVGDMVVYAVLHRPKTTVDYRLDTIVDVGDVCATLACGFSLQPQSIIPTEIINDLH